MYTSAGGGVFISFGDLTDTVKATKEYYSRFPDTGMIFLKWAAIILGGLTLLNIIIALAELEREKKYYRDTEIIRTGELRGK